MTSSLQQLIDESVFISTEHQARLAELSRDVEWDIDFSAPSFSLQSDPPVSLTPHLLGTDSTSRGSWIWAWQELGHFPAEAVAAAVQTRETGARNDVEELISDEIPSQDGLARRLTLAAKAVTGLWAHYPAQVGGGVTAWLLLEGAELELPALSIETMMRVIGETLQTGTAEDHVRAVDSYVRLRGAHIEWDGDTTCVITTRDGAQRLWFEDRRIDAAESADPLVGPEELSRLEEQATARREALRADRDDALRIAAEQSERDRRAREAEELARREATVAAESAAPEDSEEDFQAASDQQDQAGPPLPAELSREDLEAPVPGASEDFAATSDQAPADEISREEREQRPEDEPVATYGGAAAEGQDLPFDQDPRRDVAPGEVTTSTVPAPEDRTQEQDEPIRAARSEDAVGVPATAVTPEPAAAVVEEASAERDPVHDAPDTDEPTAIEPDPNADQDAEDQPRKKGFLSRFFGR